MKIKSIFIENYKVLNDFKIDFCNNEIVNPITVFCGINGSGKTTLLEFILTSDFLKNEKDKFKIKLSDKLIYYKAGSDNDAASKQIIDFIDELIYERDIRSSEAYHELRISLNETLKSLNLEVEFDSLDKNKEIYFKNEQSNKIKLKELSGGEREVITKIPPLYISSIKDSVILIDEPESSLHPNWQNEIVNLYQEVAKKKMELSKLSTVL